MQTVYELLHHTEPQDKHLLDKPTRPTAVLTRYKLYLVTTAVGLVGLARKYNECGRDNRYYTLNVARRCRIT